MRTIDRLEANEFVESWMKIIHPEFYENLFAIARQDFVVIAKAYEENLMGVHKTNISPQSAEYFGYDCSDISREESRLYDDYIREIEAAEEDLADDIADYIDKHFIELNPEFRKLVDEVNIAQCIFDRIINPSHYSGKVKSREVA